MEIKTKRIIYLCVGFVLLLLTGLIYAWSIFIVPLENEFGWVRAETAIIFTITMGGFCLGGMINGFIIGKTSPRLTLCMAAVLFFVGFFFASRTESLWQIFISYGVFVGLGVGFVYNTIISTIAKWFPDRRGFSSGICMMGFGLGGFILGAIASRMLEVTDWRIVFIAFAIAFPILVLVSSFIIRSPRQNETEILPKPIPKKIKTSGVDSDSPETVSTPKEVKDVNTLGMLKTPVFWIFFIWSTLMTGAGLIVIGHASPIAGSFFQSTFVISIAVGIVTIFNGIARVFYGMLFDRFGVTKAIYTITINGIVASLLMIGAVLTNSAALLVPAFILTGAFYGGTPITNSTFVMSQYGQKNFAANFSVVNLCLLIAPTLGTYVAAVLYDSASSYLPGTGVMIGYAGASILLAFIISRLIKRRNA